ncbi:hypothetical protein [Burkholderia sp. B21-007]|uniref:hypothetical protein n=1 Tax=Burkholderia sp. B21-007 TaxID=2890407 RepID=UPI001E51D71E|nr:hypothetical protein [Burkholderia sp. B21-007]UEP31575.1 hypothetical protein LMA01_20420 [Burkholderia sp. B21-007]
MEKLNELLREYAQSIRRDDGTAFIHADAIRELFRAPRTEVAGAVPAAVIDALRFYAHGHHFSIDDDHQQFDTVSGEPQNWLMSERDDDCTMIEDGSIAKAALCGGVLGFEEPTKPVEGEVLVAAPPSADAAAAPADERAAYAYPTIDHWLTEIAGDREVGHIVSEMTHMEVARQAWCAARAAASQPAAAADISAMVDRFLGWKLPHDFSPDCGISFTPPSNPHWGPIGTNLLNADQARQMFEYVVGTLPVQPAAAAGQEAVAWQVRRADGRIGGVSVQWENCTKELYDATLSTGRYAGYENGPRCEVRALCTAPPAQVAKQHGLTDEQKGAVQRAIDWCYAMAFEDDERELRALLEGAKHE